VFADSGYAGEKFAEATLIAVEIVRKHPDQVGFAVQPRRGSSSDSLPLCLRESLHDQDLESIM